MIEFSELGLEIKDYKSQKPSNIRIKGWFLDKRPDNRKGKEDEKKQTEEKMPAIHRLVIPKEFKEAIRRLPTKHLEITSKKHIQGSCFWPTYVRLCWDLERSEPFFIEEKHVNTLQSILNDHRWEDYILV